MERDFTKKVAADIHLLFAQLKDNHDRFGEDNPVLIRPNDRARQERIIDVLNGAAAAGVKNLTFS